MTDWNRYVGIPSLPHGRTFAGTDCWGLVRLVFLEERGIRLPNYADRCPDLRESAEIARILTHERDKGPWEEVARPEPFDVLLFRVGAYETHVGIAVDSRNMLHTFGDAGAVIVPIEAPQWRKRLVGVYRYAGPASVQVITAPGPLPDQARRVFDVAPTATLEEMLQHALPDLPTAARQYLRVTLSDGKDTAVIPPHMWARVRPHPGTMVAIRVVPGASAIAGFLTAQFINLTGIATLGAAQAVYAASYLLVGLGVSALTSVALNALTPVPDTPSGPRAGERAYALAGWRNTASPGDAVPMPYGRIRTAPLYAMRPYQEVVGNDQYVRALFCFGYGRLDISDIRIGDTPITEFEDVEIETREGVAGDAPLTLTPIQVLEQPEQIEMLYPWPVDAEGNEITSGDREEQPIVRTTASNTTRVGLVFAFPSGLFWFKDEKKLNQDMSIRIRERQKGTTTWTDVTTVTYTERKLDGFFRQYTWDLPSRGTWEIEVTRVTPMYENNPQRVARVFLSAVQSYRPEYPLNMNAPLALCAVKMRASYQLNGTLDTLNAVVTRYAPDWNGSAWVEAQTRNPASLFAYALQGPDNPYPVPDDEIDWDRLAEWHYFCATKGLHYDRDQRASEGLIDRLRVICAAGRASPWHDGAKWSIVIDSPSAAVTASGGTRLRFSNRIVLPNLTGPTVSTETPRFVAHLNPRNTYGFSGSRSYLDTPDAVRVRFLDDTEDYTEAEVLVPWPGATEPYDVVEQWDIVGKTNPEEIQREVYRLMQIAELRRDRWTVEQSDEFRVVTRGDAVRLSHYVLSDVQVSGRVKTVDGDAVVLDEAVTMVAGQSYALRYTVISEADPVGSSLLTAVATKPGTTNLVRITGATIPPVGTLVDFGLAEEDTFAALVLDIEPGQDFSSTISLTNLAPEIDTLTDAYVPAEWNPVVGSVVDVGVDPIAPVYTGIATLPALGEYGTDVRLLSISVTSASLERALIAGFDIDHRLQGAGTWTTATLSGGWVTATPEYDAGDIVETRARALDFDGDYGPYTAETSFVVGSDLGAVAAAPDLAAITVTGGLGRAEITLAHSDPATTAIQIFRTPNGDAFDAATDTLGEPVTVPAGEPVVYIDGDATRSDYLSATWTAGGGWGSATLPATHTPGSASTLSQTLAVEVRTYRGQLTMSGRTAGSVTVQFAGGTPVATPAISANGATLFELVGATGNDRIEIVATSDFDGTIDSMPLDRETAACAPQGIFDYRFAALNADEIGSAVTSATTVTII